MTGLKRFFFVLIVLIMANQAFAQDSRNVSLVNEVFDTWQRFNQARIVDNFVYLVSGAYLRSYGT